MCQFSLHFAYEEAINLFILLEDNLRAIIIEGNQSNTAVTSFLEAFYKAFPLFVTVKNNVAVFGAAIRLYEKEISFENRLFG